MFGQEGRLVEITSAEIQELAVAVIKAAEETFTIGDPELSYWWTGLKDEDDDKQWVWETSKMINYYYQSSNVSPQVAAL